MYYIKFPTVRFMGLVRSNLQGRMVFEGLKNLDGIRQKGLGGHLWMDGGKLKRLKDGLKKFTSASAATYPCVGIICFY